MKKKLTVATSLFPLGRPSGQKLFKIPGGQYAGRLAAVIQTSASEIKLTWADAPYALWSIPITAVSDAADYSFDAQMDSAGNIHIAYTDSSNHFATKKLTFGAGVWSVGSKVLIYDAAPCYALSLAIEPSGKLWVTWSRYVAPNSFIHVKSSSDEGTTWGAGSSDSGTQLTTGDLTALSKLLIAPNHVHVIALYGHSRIVMRSLPIAGGNWSEEFTVGTTLSSFNEEFDGAVAPDGRVAVVFNDPEFKYREFDGYTWGAVVSLASVTKTGPQLFFRNGDPVVAYLEPWNGYQRQLVYTERRAGVFTTPKALDCRARALERVLLYNQAAASYTDVTSEAEDEATGDVFHPESSSLLKSSGDQMYAGMNVQFRYLQVLLSTVGSGGTLVYSYWDGANWRAFTPTSGVSPLDVSPTRIALWDDYDSMPPDWQKRSVDGHSLFWVKVEVASAYAVGPVGTQITTISEISAVTFRR